MIRGFDHVAITVADLDATCRFYARAVDARVEETYVIDGKVVVKRLALGSAILNVHQQGNGIDLVARIPQPGSADLCFRFEGDISEARLDLEARGVAVIEGPVQRVSAAGNPAKSIYFHDIDGNLIELLAE
jgi:catechol 2,3-dioxygenase-like lactoylglutathione lyase family enzyme